MKSVYEQELVDKFLKALSEHLDLPHIRYKVRTGPKIKQEIRKFARQWDKKYLTDFADTIGEE